MSQFEVKPAELEGYAQYMRTQAGEFSNINSFTQSSGCDTSGFMGLLAILIPAVNAVGSFFGGTLDTGQNLLNASAEGLSAAARIYQLIDQLNANRMDSTRMPEVPQPVPGCAN